MSIAGVAVLCLAAAGDELAHDDGKADAKRSTAGTGHAVLFERPEAGFAVTAVRVHGSRYGGDYDPEYALARVSLCDERMQVFARAFEPYASWRVGAESWVDVAIPPALVPARFYAVVELFPAQTKGIYVSVDEDAHGHSYAGSPGELGALLDRGEWMIRVTGTAKELRIEEADRATCEVLARGSGEAAGRKSTAGIGHAVLFKRPAKLGLATAVSLFGERYGGGYDPERTFFHVFLCDRKLNAIARTAFPYSVFPTGAPAWVDLELPAAEVPREFGVLVHFDPTQAKGVYLGQWSEEQASSLAALPGRSGEKLERGAGWMVRTTVCASAGKTPLAAVPEESADGPDALELASVREAVDAAERAGEIGRARELLAGLSPEEAARIGAFAETEHFVVRHIGVPAPALAALERVLEAAHGSLTARFGVERLGAVPGRKVHVHVTIEEGASTELFTDPESAAFSRIVLRGPASALAPPTSGGPHVVYGFCHELGHVLAGWTDDRHQWAHYVGSQVASDVDAALGEDVWPEPYDVNGIEGLPRFLREIEGAEPSFGDDAAVARLLHEIGLHFGQDVFARALAWIREHREGEPFHAVRLYSLESDLRDALLAVTEDPETVRRLFGG